MKSVPHVDIWVSDYGPFRLPADFPSSVIREDGWFDRRYGIYLKVREYIDEQTNKLASIQGDDRSDFVAPSFVDWMTCGSPPNRLYGAEVKPNGDAV